MHGKDNGSKKLLNGVVEEIMMQNLQYAEVKFKQTPTYRRNRKVTGENSMILLQHRKIWILFSYKFEIFFNFVYVNNYLNSNSTFYKFETPKYIYSISNMWFDYTLYKFQTLKDIYSISNR